MLYTIKLAIIKLEEKPTLKRKLLDVSRSFTVISKRVVFSGVDVP